MEKDKRKTRINFKLAIRFLFNQYFFIVGNFFLRQAIDNPLGSDLAPFMANSFLYCYAKSDFFLLRKTN